jgi:hypothetical protein
MRRDSPPSGRCPQFTEDHEAFRELARDFIEKKLVPASSEWEKGGVFWVEPFGPHSLTFVIRPRGDGRGALSNGSEQERFTCRLVFGNT